MTHTQAEYGYLLREALEKKGFRVGLWMNTERVAAVREKWEGFLEIRRRQDRARDYAIFYPMMLSDASIYIGASGRIELLYREKIVVNPAKRSAREAVENEYLAQLEKDAQNRESMDEEEYEAWAAAQDTEEILLTHENFDELSEQEELAVLRALNNSKCRICLPDPKNETHLQFEDEYFITSCSRAGAKRAAEWVHEKLWNVCCEIARLVDELGFERVVRERTQSGWISESVIDDFDQIEEYADFLRK